MKRVYWEFDKEKTVYISAESSEADLEKQFKFELTRHKNKRHEEWLEIQCKYKDEDNGRIQTCLSDLDKDIRKFEKFGVAFDGFVYASLALVIRKNYLLLEPSKEKNESEAVLTDEVFKKILEMIVDIVKEYYSDNKDDKDVYNIPVEDFNSYIEDSEYNMYKISDIRQCLKDNEYIECGQGRTSKLVRLGNGSKPVRVISFIKEKIDNYKSYVNNAKSNEHSKENEEQSIVKENKHE